jgi:hypothetical protein
MKELRSEIDIQAPAEKVWQVLTDFASFPQWNPFIRRATGEVRVGAHLDVYIQPSGASGSGFKPTVLKVEPNRELRWLGQLLMPGLFDGEHVFLIEPLEEKRVRFVQREVFNGMLVPLLARSLDTNTRRGFDEMNQALKMRVENAA